MAANARSLLVTVGGLGRSITAHRAAGDGRALCGIIQGGGFEALRRRAVEAACAYDLPGSAIGGLAVGETKSLLYDIAGLVAGLLPADRPPYLMGVGRPHDRVQAVAPRVDPSAPLLHT